MSYTDIIQMYPDSVFNRDNDSNNAKMFSLFRSQIDLAETVFEDLKYARQIESRGGAVLDLIGEIVRGTRDGRNDESFRIFLMTAFQKLICTGSIESLQSVFRAIAGEYFIGVWDLTPGLTDESVITDRLFYLDGSRYLDGSYYLSGSINQPAFFEVRLSGSVPETLKAYIESIIAYVKPAGIKSIITVGD